jgi:hypothetical protein
MSYREIWNVSELLGAHLIERVETGEIASGATIPIIGSSHPLVLACILACAKSGCAFALMSELTPWATAQTLETTTVLIAQPEAGDTDILARALDAQRIRGYIVPGMTDDDTCNCGMEDCLHGPFLQLCMPSSWLDGSAVFCQVLPGVPESARKFASNADAAPTENIKCSNIDSQIQAAGVAAIAPSWQFAPDLTESSDAFEFLYGAAAVKQDRHAG